MAENHGRWVKERVIEKSSKKPSLSEKLSRRVKKAFSKTARDVGRASIKAVRVSGKKAAKGLKAGGKFAVRKGKEYAKERLADWQEEREVYKKAYRSEKLKQTRRLAKARVRRRYKPIRGRSPMFDLPAFDPGFVDIFAKPKKSKKGKRKEGFRFI